jgi:signal transduction histidine kinase
MLSYNGDETSIRQIVGILLDNAIKYSKTDDIEVKLEKKNKNIVITVINSSDPVSDEQLHHFFDRFYRTEQSNKSSTGGYGLGLSIAKSIVEKHKGRISASAPDNNTVQITLTLPINH